jgi:hypothetical protein
MESKLVTVHFFNRCIVRELKYTISTKIMLPVTAKIPCDVFYKH